MFLTELTLSEAAELIARREISPVELTQAHIERILRVDPYVNSFITLMDEYALKQARQAEEALRDGESLSPLHGIPVALKDLFETQGVRTTAGSKVLADYLPDEDAVVVRNLHAAGAVVLGKLNMHEIALGVTNVNPHFGACHNPWNLERISGGSSGGSAAALAAGLCLGALGSDTGGSIRIPSSLCGVVGLKPTYGRVSLRGVIPLSWNLDHVGPMARRVRDIALILGIIAGYDPGDPYSVNVPVPDYLTHLGEGVQRWRIALASDEFFARADGEVRDAVAEAARVFERLGAHVNEVEVPDGREAARANGLMTPADAAAFHHEHLLSRPQDFGADVLQRLKTGAAYTSTEYILARRTQTLMKHQFVKFFESCDILLAPATPVAAPPIEGPDAVEQARLLTRFTAPFNLTGLPALSLPCGFTAGGLPVGLQIISRPWAEDTVLRAAYAFEQATDWHLRNPETTEIL
jgi:aspartyl-tRNA(Asn)/glutamyl-tRNA(Gln) amidotransferase subunit A